MAKRQWNRREFLKNVGGGILAAAAFDPVLMMIEQIFNSKAHEAMAGTNPSVRNFVYITQLGAPSRWTYDLVLNPYPNPGSTSLPTIYPNQNMQTNFVTGNATTGTGWGLEYKSYAYKTPGGSTINLPYFWSGNMPIASNGTASGSTPMTKLLASALFVRGVSMPNDSHQTNQSKLLSPAQAEPTIPTLYQRNANEIVSNPTATSSMSSILTPINKTNYAYRQGTSTATKFEKVHDSINSALEQLSAEAKKNNPTSSALYDLNKSVDSSLSNQFFSNLDSLLTNYNTALTKYTALFDACLNLDNYPITGFSKNTPIPNTAPTGAIVNPLTSTAMNSQASMAQLGISPMTNSDLRTMLVAGGKAGGGTYTNYPQQFAVAETLLLAGLSKYVRIIDSAVFGMHFEGLTSPYGYSDFLGSSYDASQVTAYKTTTWTYDEHGASPGPIIICQSYLYRGLNACIYELSQQLKNAGVWDNSVIMVSGEFNRNPNNNDAANTAPEKSQYGTGHQGYGNSFTIYSGMVQDTLCLGNIQEVDQTYFGSLAYGTATDETKAIAIRGTTGWAAPLNVNGRNEVLTHSAFSSSICDLLGIPRIFTNFDPIWKIDNNNKIVPLVDRAQNNKFTG